METNLLGSLSNQLADAVERIGASLVTVNGRERQSATGVVFAPGMVLTADHVLERDDNLTVAGADGVAHPAVLVGRDSSTDLAVLKVAGLTLAAATVAAPARVGQLAVAVGRPSAEGLMASLGVVSAVGGPLKVGRGAQLEKYIRTDATPYPGFSGGPLTDATGALLGIITTGLTRGEPIAIPVELAISVASALQQQGSVKRGFLGVVSQQVKLPANLRTAEKERGLLIVKVEDNSPAEQGGLLVGDTVTALDGHSVADADDLLGLLVGDRVGRAVTINIIRGGVATTTQVTVGQRN